MLLAILVIVPSVGASPTGVVNKSLAAPYTGTPVKVKEIITSGCGAYHFLHTPSFNMTSGVGRVEVNATATSAASCRIAALPSDSEVVGVFGFSSRNFSLSAGAHTVTSVWDLHWTANLSATGAQGTPSNVTSGVVIEVLTEIFDVTANTEVASNEWQKSEVHQGDAAVHFVGSKQLNLTVGWTVNATHVYSALVVLEYGAAVDVAAGASGAQASALLNMATVGNGATLVNVRGA